MRDPKLLLALSALAVMAVACDSKSGVEPDRKEPVVVYASNADEIYWPQLFSGFTHDTGIPVTMRFGEPSQLVDDVIANRGSPPADVLLTSNVVDVSRAADEGALRPIAAASSKHIAAFLKDPDGLWAAAGFKRSVIAYNADVGGLVPSALADLVDSSYRGRLCLTSSALPINRALIAMLISDLGKRPAERMVRGWMANAALPSFESEEQLLAAIETGNCDYGILSSQAAAARDVAVVAGNIEIVQPIEGYIDIEGVGIARHARYPESAQTLVAWLLSADGQKAHAKGANLESGYLSFVEPTSVSQNNIGLAAWRDDDAVLLAERAGYR